jgi:hypothetical protein
MHLVLRKPERSFHRSGERCTDKSSAVVPATLMPRQRFYAHFLQLVGKTKPMQNSRGVRTNCDPGAYLTDRPGLFIDMHIHACTQK